METINHMRLYSLKEASAILDKPRHTIYNWCRRGHVASVKIGSAYFLRGSTLLVLLGCVPEDFDFNGGE